MKYLVNRYSNRITNLIVIHSTILFLRVCYMKHAHICDIRSCKTLCRKYSPTWSSTPRETCHYYQYELIFNIQIDVQTTANNRSRCF